jgi:hypothetical protein
MPIRGAVAREGRPAAVALPERDRGVDQVDVSGGGVFAWLVCTQRPNSIHNIEFQIVVDFAVEV